MVPDLYDEDTTKIERIVFYPLFSALFLGAILAKIRRDIELVLLDFYLTSFPAI